MALYNPQQYCSHAFLYGGYDPGVACRIFEALCLWLLGYPDQALKRSHEGLALAGGLSHPFSLALALGGAALFHLLRREEQVARERAEAVMTLSTEQGFPFWLAVGTMVQGWALTEQGQVKEGIAQMRQGMAAYQDRVFFLAPLAEAYGKVGQVEEGLTVLAEALAAVDRIGERMYEAELYQLKGEFLLAQEGKKQKPVLSLVEEAKGKNEEVSEAEECFHKAIEIARRQSAKSLELRASTSLARLWHKQGKKEEARKLLAEIYGWFTEGFDTKDLQEAKALLGEMQG